MNAQLRRPIAGVDSPANEGSAQVRALVQILDELASLVTSLSDEQYRADSVGVMTGSIGGHVRHCLDHVRALVVGLEQCLLNYEQRERGTDIEYHRVSALSAMNNLIQSLAVITPEMLAWPLRVTAMPTSDGPVVEYASSVGREVSFVASHTIHHNAVIAAMARTLGAAVPERFGYAPSTMAYLDRRSTTTCR